MFAGFLLSGMFVGAIAAFSSLVNGHSVLYAVAVYSGIGSLTLVTVMLAGLLLHALREDSEGFDTMATPKQLR